MTHLGSQHRRGSSWLRMGSLLGFAVVLCAHAMDSVAEGIYASADVAGVDILKLTRQAHFAYRSDGEGFATSQVGYYVRVERNGDWLFQTRRPLNAAALRLATSAVGDEVERANPSDVRVAADGSLTIARGRVVESLRNSREGVEQSWAFATRPDVAHDLVVRVAVSGQRYAGATDKGLHFVDPDTGLGLRYGVAAWVDAAGRRTELMPRFVDGEIVLSVPAEVVASATFPALLDPVISVEQGTDNPITSPVVGGTESPAIAFIGNGNYLVVWSDCRASCGVWGARVNASTSALLDPDGFPISDPADGNVNFVNLAGPGTQGVACDSAQCLVTWDASHSSPPSEQLRGRFIDKATGSATGGEFTISNPGDNWEGGSVAFNGTNYLVGYSLLGPGVNPVVGNIVTPAGVVGAQFVISPSCATASPNPCASQHRNPVLASDGASFYAVWSEQDVSTSANAYFAYVFGAGVSGAGTAGATTAVTPLSQAWDHGLFLQPAVAWDGAYYDVAWTDYRAGATNPDIWARRVSQAFAPEATELQVSSDASAQTQPSLARSGSNLLAAFADARSGGAIYGQLLTSSASLALSGSNFSIATGATDSGPAAASDGSNYAVAFSGYQAQAYTAGVTAGGAMQFAAERVSNSANAQFSPVAAFDGANFLVLWADSRNAPDWNGIYGARVAPDGTVIDPNGIAVSTTDAESAPQVAFATASSSYLAVFNAGQGIGARRVNQDGSTPSPQQAIPAGFASVGNPFNASVVSDGTNFLVVLTQPASDTPPTMLGALLDSNANVLLSPITIATFNSPTSTAAAYSGSTQRYFVAWADSGVIHGQRLANCGAGCPPTQLDGAAGLVISNPSDSSNAPAVTYDGTNFIVVWSDRAMGASTRTIHGTRVSTAGIVLDVGGVPLTSAGPNDQVSPSVVFDGANLVVSWMDQTGNLSLTRVSRDLSTVIDSLAVGVGASTGPALATTGGGETLIAHSQFDATANIQSERVKLRFFTEPTDTLPPTTLASLAPPPNGAGWNNSPATVTLTASDNAGGSGVNAIHYSLTGAQAGAGIVAGSTAAVPISTQGVTTLSYFSVDNAGNQELNHNLTIRLDTTPPVPAVPASVSVTATKVVGAVASYSATVTDNLDPAPTINCKPPSGSLFPIGTTTVTCTGTDVAGNAANASFPVIVNPPATLTALIDFVNNLGLAFGLSTSLIAKLDEALINVIVGRTAAACSALNAFINAVNAQSGKGITPAQASALIAGANRIRTALGCS